jgi:hypothetical protein
MDGMTLPPSPMQSLQAEHERLLARLDESGGAPCPGPEPVSADDLSFELQALIHEARAYIERAQVESEWIVEARDRSQLRANLRFWASFLLNCTGTYPDTTLRPAHTYRSQLSVLPGVQPVSEEQLDSPDPLPEYSNGEVDGNEGTSEEDSSERASTEGSQDLGQIKPAWYSHLSRGLGLAAILIVGVIPLAAVCLALSLFYSLDNQTQFVWSGNFATQTARVAINAPAETPESPFVRPSTPENTSTESSSGSVLPLVFAEVTLGGSSQGNTICQPVLVLSMEAPVSIDQKPIPPGKVLVSLAGTGKEIASGRLEPGLAPLSLQLGAVEPDQKSTAWLVQVEHPWLDVEAVILPVPALGDCVKNQVSIRYVPQAGAEVWRPASDTATAGDLGLTWTLLTWGPDALEGQDWVAAVKLQGAGGNGHYVYFAEGDLAVPSVAGEVQGILTDDELVLGQKTCQPGVARVGVTSGGKVLRRLMAVQVFARGCR